ncbi:MAG: hypothetical protein AAB562_01800 [Patescibacteria group bacterium]
MTNTLKLGRRAFTIGVVTATIAWSVGLGSLLAPLAAKAATLNAGDLIKASQPAVYYHGSNGKRYVFPNEKSYKTWYSDFSTVKTITDAELAAVAIGGNVTYRPGVKMVKITTDPKVYAVALGGVLRWVKTEALASGLYGSDWNQMVEDVPDAFFTNYTVGTDVAVAGDYDKAAALASAPDIGTDKSLAATAGGGALSLSLASDNPASGSIVADSDNDTNGSSQRADMLKIRFTSNAGAVKVTKLLVRRSGIMADSDVDALYLYEGAARLTQNNSLATGIATFDNSAGLFTVPAGGSKELTLKMDVDNNTSSGKTVTWSLAAADVSSDATSVSGSATGNQQTVASVTDLGYLEVANVTPTAATTVDPQDGYELWRFKFDANDQNLLVKRATLTNVGSVDSDDLQNFSLWDGGTQLGSTLAMVDGTKLTFDLSAMADGGFKMISGQSKQLVLKGDIKGGTNRTYRWTVQNTTDVVTKDLNYNVETVLAADGAAFSVQQAGGATTINTGTLTVQIASDAPISTVPDGTTNVLLAKWKVKAAGEDVQVDTLDIACGSSDTSNILKNVKLTFGGAQVGTTMSSLTCNSSTPSGTDFSFGNTFIAPAGVEKMLEFKADLTDATVASTETLSAQLTVGSSNAKGRVSLTAISTSAVSGNTLTVASGGLTVTKNLSLANLSASTPLGVGGTNNVRIGSMVITGGAEQSDVTSIVLKDDVDTSSDTVTLADYFVNMKLMKGSTQLGTTVGSLTDTDSTTYTYSVSPALRISVGETVVVDVYADIKSTLGAAVSNLNTDDTNGEVIADSVSASGLTSSTDTGYTTDVPLQDLFIATNGSLRVTQDADTPTDQQMVLGSTGLTMAKFKFAEESNAEDVLVTKIVVADNMTSNSAVPFNATGTVKNIKLYDGTTLLGSIASLDQSKNSVIGLAVFDLAGLTGGGVTIPKSSSKTLTVKADMTPWSEGGSSSTTHQFLILRGFVGANASTTDWDRTTAAYDDSVVAIGKGSGFSISSTNATAASGLVTGSTTGSTQTQASGNVMDALRTKLSFAHASDAPSGLQTKSSEATVAKFVVSNTSNVGNYSVTLKQLNLDINQSGISITTTRTLRIYKDTIDSANQLATTDFSDSGSNTNYQDTQLTEANLTDLEIAAGASRTIIVTLDTSDASIDANNTLSVGIQTGATGGQSAVQWSDGAMLTLTEVNGLPLSGKTLSY